ncbi:hypothetical protein [Nostoc sp. ChiQUE01b]|nr:hypothetical protein [Nostoc sp. ChiQUE01b]MDZ8264177.1 hypothetical protein [Nostoc sp. ChiQUE01b]
MRSPVVDYKLSAIAQLNEVISLVANKPQVVANVKRSFPFRRYIMSA